MLTESRVKGLLYPQIYLETKADSVAKFICAAVCEYSENYQFPNYCACMFKYSRVFIELRDAEIFYVQLATIEDFISMLTPFIQPYLEANIENTPKVDACIAEITSFFTGLQNELTQSQVPYDDFFCKLICKVNLEAQLVSNDEAKQISMLNYFTSYIQNKMQQLDTEAKARFETLKFDLNNYIFRPLSFKNIMLISKFIRKNNQ